MSDRMRLLGLPQFATVKEFAALVRIDPSRLKVLALKAERFYRTYRIPKKNRGWRTISSPSKELKAVQAWILRNILDKLSPSRYATAYVKGRALLGNVRPHAGNRYFLSVDVKDFFPSVEQHRVHHIFTSLGYPKLAALTLTRLCTYFWGLPQGGVTSPALSNLVCLRLDLRLAGLASRRNVVFTRYADDITLSTNKRNALPRLLPLVYRILRSEAFEPNEGKTRFLGPRRQCCITGLVKNAARPHFGIGKKKKLAMRAVMHNLLAPHPPGSVRSDSHYPNEASILGWLSFLRNVDPASHDQMSRYWTAQKAKYPKT